MKLADPYVGPNKILKSVCLIKFELKFAYGDDGLYCVE